MAKVEGKKPKLGEAHVFPYGSPNNPMMYACVIAIKASSPKWTTADFEKIVKKIQQEAFNAGVISCAKLYHAGRG